MAFKKIVPQFEGRFERPCFRQLFIKFENGIAILHNEMELAVLITHLPGRVGLGGDLFHQAALLQVLRQLGPHPAENGDDCQRGEDPPVQQRVVNGPVWKDQVGTERVDQQGHEFQLCQDTECETEQEQGQKDEEQLLDDRHVHKHYCSVHR